MSASILSGEIRPRRFDGVTRVVSRHYSTLVVAVMAIVAAGFWISDGADLVWRAIHSRAGVTWLGVGMLGVLVLRWAVRIERRRPLPIYRASAPLGAAVATVSGATLPKAVAAPAEDVGPMSIDRRAHHEAAHAYVMIAMGGTVRSADCNPRGNSGGQVSGTFPLGSRGEVEWAWLVTSVAGNVIDLERDERDGGSSFDFGKAWQHAMALLSCGHRPDGYDGAMTADGLIIAATDRARGILQESRANVEAIAHHLVMLYETRRSAGDAELREIIVLQKMIEYGKATYREE